MLMGHRKVTFAQGYDNRAHLLLNKTTPYSWIIELFNDFRTASPGGNLSKFGARLKDAYDARTFYFEEVTEHRLGARFEIVVTHRGPTGSGRDIRSGRETLHALREKLFAVGAIVVVNNFGEATRKMLFESHIAERIIPIQPISGSVMPGERMRTAHDRGTMLHVWLVIMTLLRSLNYSRFIISRPFTVTAIAKRARHSARSRKLFTIK